MSKHQVTIEKQASLGVGVGSNKKTIRAYRLSVAEYITGTAPIYDSRHKPLLRYLDSCAEHLPTGGTIFEIGSATTRDAQYLRSKGARVTCSDAVPEFVDYLKSTGEKAVLFNLLTDPITGRYDMFFANAVMPHFTPDELEFCLVKIHMALDKHGLFALNIKQGKGDAWIKEKIGKERYICYWRPTDLLYLAKQVGYNVVYLEKDVAGENPEHIWSNIILQKA